MVSIGQKSVTVEESVAPADSAAACVEDEVDLFASDGEEPTVKPTMVKPPAKAHKTSGKAKKTTEQKIGNKPTKEEGFFPMKVTVPEYQYYVF